MYFLIFKNSEGVLQMNEVSKKKEAESQAAMLFDSGIEDITVLKGKTFKLKKTTRVEIEETKGNEEEEGSEDGVSAEPSHSDAEVLG